MFALTAPVVQTVKMVIGLMTADARLASRAAKLALTPPPVTPVYGVITWMQPMHASLVKKAAMNAMAPPPVLNV